MRIAITFLCTLAALSSALFPQGKGWRGLVPLHSTRADVEKLLGPASNECRCSYYSDEVNVFVVYAEGTCDKGGSGGWNVPPGTVISFSVYPKVKPTLNDLKVDISRYKQVEDAEVEGITYFSNEKDGRSLEVYKGVVISFRYEPTLKDRDLRCPRSTYKQPAE